jgi:hypothetical protein
MSSLTQHSQPPRRPALQIAEPAGAAGSYDRHPRGSARRLRAFDAAAVILAAVALATLQASDFRLTAIVVSAAVLAKAAAVGGRRWRTTRGVTRVAGDHRSPVLLEHVEPRT